MFKWLAVGLLLLVSIGISVLVFELTLRAFNYQPDTLIVDPTVPLEERFFFPDFHLSYRVKYPVTNDTSDQDWQVVRPDFRSPEDSIDQTFKVLTVGDSFTYGHALANEQTMPAHLEKILNESGYDVNVFNAGVPGYGVDQHYRMALELLDPIQPNLVIVNLHVTDFWDSNDNCLFRRVGAGRYLPVPGAGNFQYWQLHLVTKLPSSIINSKLGGALLALLNERWNPLCSVGATRFENDVVLDKIRYLLTTLHHQLEEQDVALMITAGAFQGYFDEFLLPDSLTQPHRDEHQAIKHSLQDQFEILDVNEELEKRRRYLEQAQLALFSASEAASLSGLVVELQPVPLGLFFNTSENEAETPPGYFHLNSYGNQVFAEAVAQSILNQYALPRHVVPWSAPSQ